MKIKCKCGNIVCEGEIKIVETKRGTRRRYYIDGQMNGEVHKNKSNNPKDWIGVCSKCQMRKV